MIDILPRVNPKKIVATVLLAALALGAAACSQTLTAGAAVVNGVSISQELLDLQLTAQAGALGDDADAARRALEGLIQEEVLRQAAKAKGFEASAAEVEQRFNELKAQTPDFESQLQQAGLTEATLKQRIELNLLATQLGDDLAGPITDQDLRTVYRQDRAQFRQVRARHILFAIDENTDQERAERQARAALTSLRTGESFPALARRLSDDEQTRAEGGVMRDAEGDGDWLTLSDGQLEAGFAEALWRARVGRPGGPVLDQRGYHVYLVSRKRYQPFAEIKDRLRTDLQEQQRSAAIQQLLGDEMRDARIMVNPRIGDWDPETGRIVPHESFVPAEPEESVSPPAFEVLPGQ